MDPAHDIDVVEPFEHRLAPAIGLPRCRGLGRYRVHNVHRGIQDAFGYCLESSRDACQAGKGARRGLYEDGCEYLVGEPEVVIEDRGHGWTAQGTGDEDKRGSFDDGSLEALTALSVSPLYGTGDFRQNIEGICRGGGSTGPTSMTNVSSRARDSNQCTNLHHVRPGA